MRIPESTRDRVLEAARQLNYHPNASARRLVTGQTLVLGYVERQSFEAAFGDEFLPQALRGVHASASHMGYEVLFAPIPFGEGLGRVHRLLRGGHVDGLILSGPRSDDEEMFRFLAEGGPMVLQGDWPGVEVASVDIDNHAAARQAGRHLLGLGHRRFAVVLHAPPIYTAAAARLAGFRAALAEVPGAELLDVIQASFTTRSGEEAMAELLSSRPRPSAVFVTSDTVAVGAVRAARLAGLRVPHDIALVGFDDIPLAGYVDPPLTTVHLPAYGIGWAAAELLGRLASGDDVRQRRIRLETELVVRESCGAGIERGTIERTSTRPFPSSGGGA